MNKLIRRLISLCLVVTFGTLQFVPMSYAQAIASPFVLPPAGSKIELTNAYAPVSIKGIEINPSDSLKFNFLIDQGDEHLAEGDKKENYNKLVRYFLASLTMPEDAMWVNLSPVERDRIIPEKFSQTEMGRDLLAQDYVLKQLMASLIYPESELGKSFWAKVYQQINAKYGTTDIPVDTFNKVWIIPDEATVYERGNTAFVVTSHLKVMLEIDYLITSNNAMPTWGHVAPDADMVKGNVSPSTLPTSQPTNAKEPQGALLSPNVQAATLVPNIQDISKNIIREIILPSIEQEVNEGKNFAQLRQITNSLILATWFKRKVMSGMNVKATQVSDRTPDNPLVDYIGHQKISGIDLANKADKDKIYTQYLEAFKTGVFNFIKEEYDPNIQQTIPRKYFSGGWTGENYARITKVVTDSAELSAQAFSQLARSRLDNATVVLNNFEKGVVNFLKPRYFTFEEFVQQKKCKGIDPYSFISVVLADTRRTMRQLYSWRVHEDRNEISGSNLSFGYDSIERFKGKDIRSVIVGNIRIDAGSLVSSEKFLEWESLVYGSEDKSLIIRTSVGVSKHTDIVSMNGKYNVAYKIQNQGLFNGKKIILRQPYYAPLGSIEDMWRHDLEVYLFLEKSGVGPKVYGWGVADQGGPFIVLEDLGTSDDHEFNDMEFALLERLLVRLIAEKIFIYDFKPAHFFFNLYIEEFGSNNSQVSLIDPMYVALLNDFSVGDVVQVYYNLLTSNYMQQAWAMHNTSRRNQLIRFLEKRLDDLGFSGDRIGSDYAMLASRKVLNIELQAIGIMKDTLKDKKLAAKDNAASSDLGGIDMNPANINLKTKAHASGRSIAGEPQGFENVNIEGFFPIIINITPVTNLPALLGIV